MSILVTGGTGSLGYSILSNLSGTNHELYSFSDELPQPWQKVEGVQYLTGDLLDFRDVLEMIQKVSPTHIYHLASQSSASSFRPSSAAIRERQSAARPCCEMASIQRRSGLSGQYAGLVAG